MDTAEQQEIKEPKQSHKKKYVAIVIVCIIVCFCLVLLWWNRLKGLGSFEVTNHVKISDNLYYDKDTLNERAHKGDEENILSDYRLLSEYLAVTYPQQVFYVDYFNYSNYTRCDTNEKVSSVTYVVSQMIDGAIVDGAIFSIEVNDNKVRDLGYNYSAKFVQDVLKLDRKISVEEAVNKAKRIARQNEDVMQKSVSDAKCFYAFRYNDEDGFYYRVYFGNGGCLGQVDIDAKTGEVLYSNFSNGLID